MGTLRVSAEDRMRGRVLKRELLRVKYSKIEFTLTNDVADYASALGVKRVPDLDSDDAIVQMLKESALRHRSSSIPIVNLAIKTLIYYQSSEPILMNYKRTCNKHPDGEAGLFLPGTHLIASLQKLGESQIRMV
jgi:hypothetical protein